MIPQPARPTSPIRAQRPGREHGIGGRSPRRRRQLRPRFRRSALRPAGGAARGGTPNLGSPRVVVDVATGEVMLAVKYDVFGKPEKVGGSWDLDELPFGFAGGMFDQETGLVRFGARHYDPMTGRWTSKDPIRFQAGQGNLYVYVGGDPVNSIDITGLSIFGGDPCTTCLTSMGGLSGAAVLGCIALIADGVPLDEIPICLAAAGAIGYAIIAGGCRDACSERGLEDELGDDVCPE